MFSNAGWVHFQSSMVVVAGPEVGQYVDCPIQLRKHGCHEENGGKFHVPCNDDRGHDEVMEQSRKTHKVDEHPGVGTRLKDARAICSIPAGDSEPAG
eukprot:CAMPEP_0170638130 /NCGR_PEP_ID=MMETSP0224-20130122/38838_1 /TAXON_ID=285029 /ORGANISM="Togula jolla, Strain CCCM 725" /LENGTH=96 /DNA_ID=CAMNT_0010968171 /DNA_START=874 /DNA_END=1164 /DNA_ORIENTATION=+